MNQPAASSEAAKLMLKRGNIEIVETNIRHYSLGEHRTFFGGR